MSTAPSFRFRPLTEADLPLLWDWLNRPHVAAWWRGEVSIDEGLGTAMVRQFTVRLMEDPAVTEIRVDPSPDNGRAIRCYEKAGFRPDGEITTPDGPALMMVLERGVGVPGLVEPIGIEPTTS